MGGDGVKDPHVSVSRCGECLPCGHQAARPARCSQNAVDGLRPLLRPFQSLGTTLVTGITLKTGISKFGSPVKSTFVYHFFCGLLFFS